MYTVVGNDWRVGQSDFRSMVGVTYYFLHTPRRFFTNLMLHAANNLYFVIREAKCHTNLWVRCRAGGLNAQYAWHYPNVLKAE
jgi:hypothetical protein